MQFPGLKLLPVPIFMSDEAGMLRFTNDNWREIIGAETGEYWPALFPEMTPAHFAELWQACMVEGQPQRVTYREQPELGPPLWFEMVLQPVEDDDGEHRLLGALIDVTEQTISEAETSAILDTAVDAIIIIDESGTIEIFNQAACRMFGYEVQEVSGRNVSMLMTQPHRARHDQYLENYLQTGERKIIDIGRELEAVNADGRLFPVYLAVSEIRIAGRRRFTGIIRDLTEQQASRKALEEQREKLAHVGRLSIMGEMTASIAHEINQPLTAISMYAQAGLKLLERGTAGDKLKDALEKLNVQALRAGAVIERIQRFAKAQDGVRELIDPNTLLLDLLNLAESDAKLADIELAADLAEDLPALYVDPIQIQQVALNLIRNAIDAMIEIGCRNGRRIQIRSTRPQADLVEIAVTDAGPGVAEDQADLLFTPFHTTKREGMGMGLSICRSIINDHGGELNYRNNRETPGDTTSGPGATFYFRLPVPSDE